MIDYTSLITDLDEKLSEYHYVSDSEIVIPNVQYISYIIDKSIFKVKNLCAVIDLPGNMIDIGTTKHFIQFLKKSLLDKYGDAFLWKELEMCFVVLCTDALYKALKADEGKVMNEASFSLKTMLGTCFINTEVIDSFAVSTWGVYFSGDHFQAINQIVTGWSEDKKQHMRVE